MYQQPMNQPINQSINNQSINQLVYLHLLSASHVITAGKTLHVISVQVSIQTDLITKHVLLVWRKQR